MYYQNKIWVGSTAEGEGISLLPGMANRHGLIAGATGTGKTVTLKVLAESFSDAGVPVFLADIKGDLAGIMNPGADTPDMQSRIQRFGLSDKGFSYQSYPVSFFDLYGKKGIPLRTTISEMGPLLLSRILDLTDVQSDLLTIAFRIADDHQLLLIDTKDLKAILNYIADHSKEFEADYGQINRASINVIIRSIVALDARGADTFFGEPAINIRDWFTLSPEGKGMITVLDSQALVHDGTLYSIFLLWMLSELFETLPEVGDLPKPKMVFFFDEAHLLFKSCGKLLQEKIEQVVKLIRSKGVGIYFITQSPKDIPDGVLSQLGNKIQHALHAYTPQDQKAVKAAADSFRVNPAFRTAEVIESLGTGEAVVSFLQEDGTPGIAERISVLPPRSQFGGIDDQARDVAVKSSLLFTKYEAAVDPDSAYEFLMRKGLEEEAAAQRAAEEAARQKEQEKAEAAEQKAREKAEAAEQKAREKELLAQQKAAEKEAAAAAKKVEKEAAAEQRKKQQAVKSVGNAVVGTVGREVGKSLGSSFGSFGKTLGGNVGASLGRGLLSTLFKF